MIIINIQGWKILYSWFTSFRICRLSLLRLLRQSLVSSHIPFSSLLSPFLPQVVIQWRFAGQLIIHIGFSNPQVYVDRIATMIIDTIVPIRIIFLLCARKKVWQNLPKSNNVHMYFLDANFWLVFSLKTLCAPRHVFGGVTALSQLTGPATWVDPIVRNKRMPYVY